jgi:hypothetical protein
MMCICCNEKEKGNFFFITSCVFEFFWPPFLFFFAFLLKKCSGQGLNSCLVGNIQEKLTTITNNNL